MSMTIKQIAEKIGVSKPAIRQKIKRNPELETRLRELSETVGQTVYYNDEAVSMIMALFPTVSDAPETVAENVSGNVFGVSENVSGNVSGVTQPSERAEREMLRQTIDALTEQLDAKDAQLAEKDTQIAGLTAALAEAQQVQQQLASALETSQQAQKQVADALAAAQALHAGTIQMLREVQQQSQPEPPQDAPVVDAAEPEQDHSPAEEKTEVQEPPVVEAELEGTEKEESAMVKGGQDERPRRGVWARLFGKKRERI